MHGEVEFNDGEFAEVQEVGIEGSEKDLLLETIQVHRVSSLSSRQRRVRAIELTLTPQEIVLVWLRDAMQACIIDPFGDRVAPLIGWNVGERFAHFLDHLIEKDPSDMILGGHVARFLL